MESTVFLVVLGFVLAAVLVRWATSPARKGARGERAVHGLLRQSLHPSEYAILRDVTLPYEGGTTQIDHVVVSRFGIFVIETRTLSGWIFGAEKDTHWTQSLGHFRVEFQNPLRQNHAHVRALQELLGLKASRFHSLVVFAGKSEFRTEMPLNVVDLERLLPFIEVRRAPLLSVEETDRVLDMIESSRLPSGGMTDALHIESLRARHVAKTRLPRAPRRPARNGGGRLRPARALAGLASLALLLAAGHFLVGGYDGLRSVGGAWPSAWPERAAQGVADAAFQPGHLDPASVDAMRAETEGLRCGYSLQTRRCVCLDAAGARVPMEFEACKAQADAAAP